MPEISNSLVVVLGVGIVFIGLICIVILCKIMSAVCMLAEKKNNSEKEVDTASSTANSVKPIENRQELIAAVSAALAEELGTDVSALRILSFKKI